MTPEKALSQICELARLSTSGKHGKEFDRIIREAIRSALTARDQRIAELEGALSRIENEAEVLAKDCPPAPHACPACEILFVARAALTPPAK